MIYRPGIAVVERGEHPEYSLVVEVREGLLVEGSDGPEAMLELKRYMSAVGCPLGLLVTPERLWILRESFRGTGANSIDVIGEFSSPHAFCEFVGRGTSEFEDEVQRWLERATEGGGFHADNAGLRRVLVDDILPVLRSGEIRATWPRATSVQSAVG